MNSVVIYEGESGVFDVRLDGETVWLRQEQLATLFGRDRTVINRHLGNIFREGELERDQVCAKYAHTADDGKTYQVAHYNLDAIISVGYRVRSIEATRFRQWATRVLRDHLTLGFTINSTRMRDNASEFEAALALVRKVATDPDLTADGGRGLADIVTRYAQTFLLLQRYDEGMLVEPPTQAGGHIPTVSEARSALKELKAALILKHEATTLFAQERDDGLAALLGNLQQSIFGEPAYPSVESKAAHLLYFMVKNHPFVDGNKRSGAYLFVDFLSRNNRLLNEQGHPVINDVGLAALTLLVAESKPDQKSTMITLIMNMIAFPAEPPK